MSKIKHELTINCKSEFQETRLKEKFCILIVTQRGIYKKIENYKNIYNINLCKMWNKY